MYSLLMIILMKLSFYNITKTLTAGRFHTIYEEILYMCEYRDEDDGFVLSRENGEYLLMKYPEHLKERF